MQILATDLDRTLLPNGSWDADAEAIELFNRLTREHEVLVVYVTGRNLQLTEQAIQEFGVRHPDVLCGDVGTTIRQYRGSQWSIDEGWAELTHANCPRWGADSIRQALSDVAGMREQEAEHLNEFKQSYYVEHDRRQEVMAAVEDRVKDKFDEVLIYSYDSQDDKGLLDVLPRSATKQTALEYVAEEFGAKRKEVVFCGDSGNDIFPLTAGFRGVLVRNADEQLVENVHKAMADNPALEVYFAGGDFRGLSGYYTSGVIEGAYHYGLFK